MTTHHRTCNLCEAHCGILIDVEDSKITAIRGDEADPLSLGYICPKATALADLYEDPDRIRKPMVREGDEWREVSWDEGVRVAAEGIHAVQRAGGQNSFSSYIGNPSAHNTMALVGLGPLLKMLGTRNRFSASSVDQFPKMLSSYLLYGAQLAISVADIDRTDYLLVLGANPMVSNGSLMTAPGMRRRIRELKKRGGQLVILDPRRTETAKVATEHVFIRPGSDAFLLAAMIAVVFEEKLVDTESCRGLVDDLDFVEALVDGIGPEDVESLTGIEAATVRRLAREFAAAPTAACYSRIGTCVQSYGTLTSYLAEVLNIVCGRLDQPGGVMFPKAAARYSSPGSYRRWASRVRGLPEFGGELPVACLREEIETPGEGQIRGLLTAAGNPVLSTPEGDRLDEAIAGLDFMVSIDPALNETTRHANVLLPPRHSLESAHYSLIFHKLAVRDTAKFCEPLFEPAADSFSEVEICERLCAELTALRNRDREAEGLDPVENRGADLYAMGAEALLGFLLEAGPYELSMDDLRAAPSGVDLGELKSGGIGRELLHDDGRIHLVHDEISQEMARLRVDLEEQGIGGVGLDTGSGSDNSFLLIGRRQLRSNNSWMHNCPTLMTGAERCTLFMNPEDADRLGLKDGLKVNVASRVGAVDLDLHVSGEMMRGVVSMPHGFGHTRSGTRMKVAAERPGVSMNDLTDASEVEGLVGNAVLTGVPVRVSARELASV
jgi:anaerobic selenocysteine-containing dehydrogenase